VNPRDEGKTPAKEPRFFAARLLDKLDSGRRRLLRLPQLIYRLHVETNPHSDASVLLAGSGRGGTTWLAEVINYDNSYRLMFEPFNGARVRESRAFGESQYLRPDDENVAFLEPAQKIFTGSVRNAWVDVYNRSLRPKRRLIKDIRVNLMLGWIRAHFPEIPIVLLLRHPCAVAYSRWKLGWVADLERTFIAQAALVEDYLSPFVPAMRKARSAFERHVFWWCVETYVPLKQLKPNDVLITTYENCVASPQYEIRRIFQYLQEPFKDEVLQAVSKPSAETRRNWRSQNASAIVSGEELTGAWQQSLAPGNAERALEILRMFGLDTIYNLDPFPNPRVMEEWNKGRS